MPILDSHTMDFFEALDEVLQTQRVHMESAARPLTGLAAMHEPFYERSERKRACHFLSVSKITIDVFKKLATM